MKMTSRNVEMRPKCDELINDIEKRQNAFKIRRIHENDVEKHQNVSKIIRMSKFAKILIDALVAIFGIYGVDFPP